MHDHAIVISDIKGTINVWSAGCEKLLGHSSNEAVGQSLSLIVPEQYREQHWHGFHTAMREGYAKIDGKTSNVPVLCKDGDVRTFASRIHLLRNGVGQIIGAMSIFSSGEAV